MHHKGQLTQTAASCHECQDILASLKVGGSKPHLSVVWPILKYAILTPDTPTHYNKDRDATVARKVTIEIYAKATRQS